MAWDWTSFWVGAGSMLLLVFVVWMGREIKHAPLCDEDGVVIPEEELGR